MCIIDTFYLRVTACYEPRLEPLNGSLRSKFDLIYPLRLGNAVRLRYLGCYDSLTTMCTPSPPRACRLVSAMLSKIGNLLDHRLFPSLGVTTVDRLFIRVRSSYIGK